MRPDVRGLGRSPASFDLEREFTVENCIGDLVAIIDHLGAASVHYCGESMGGILGMVLAATHPQRIRTLTLVSTPVHLNETTKTTYALGHKSESDAQKEMGMKAWVAATNRKEFDPRKFLKPAMDAMQKLCKQRLQEFNTAGQASKIKRIATLSEMAARYKKGELDPRSA